MEPLQTGNQFRKIKDNNYLYNEFSISYRCSLLIKNCVTPIFFGSQPFHLRIKIKCLARKSFEGLSFLYLNKAINKIRELIRMMNE